MRHRLLSALLVLLCTTTRSQQDQKPPQWALKFEDFSVSHVFKGKPTPAIITTNWRNFRTRIREGARHGPNFAGHYTIVAWGCGAGCVFFVVVDAISGRPYDGTGSIVVSVGKTKSGRDYQGLVYHLNSRLLITDGCPDEESTSNCGIHYYEWTANQFKFLRFVHEPPAEH